MDFTSIFQKKKLWLMSQRFSTVLFIQSMVLTSHKLLAVLFMLTPIQGWLNLNLDVFPLHYKKEVNPKPKDHMAYFQYTHANKILIRINN